MIRLLLNKYVLGAIIAVAVIFSVYGKGHSDGAAKANRQAEINDLTRQLAEKERDRKAAEERASAMREQAEQNARLMLSAQGDLDDYRKELEALASAANAPSPDGATAAKLVDLSCRAASDHDVARLSANRWTRGEAVAPLPPKRP